MSAASEGYPLTANVLLTHGANVDIRYDGTRFPETGWTALMIAARERHGDIVESLFAKGADVELRNASGENALHLAAASADPSTVVAVLAKVTDVDARDNGGRTALMLAAQSGTGDVVRLLLAKGANTEAKDGHGMRPIDYARKGDDPKRIVEVVQVFQRSGRGTG